ncbi:MAG TPA: Bax inhibitor-1/YccA family protein [Candidatus Babeliales bacterium]|nr:Bax inhibitor-1/YccA family protein [Candidatus Babeliales bacterium]
MNTNHEVRHSADDRVNSILYAVYAWMAVALGITASIAYYVGNTPALYTYLRENPWVVFLLFIAQLALAFGLMLFINRMSGIFAMTMFIGYAITMGITMSFIFVVYTTASIAVTFLVAAGMFGGMALYGYFTKTDLSRIGSIGIMMVIGLIIGGLVNLLLRSPMVNMILSFVGVIAFSVLTAYDIQKIKQISRSLLADKETSSKIAIICALTLYLDFVNLFLYLLQLFGKKKEQ